MAVATAIPELAIKTVSVSGDVRVSGRREDNVPHRQHLHRCPKAANMAGLHVWQWLDAG